MPKSSGMYVEATKQDWRQWFVVANGPYYLPTESSRNELVFSDYAIKRAIKLLVRLGSVLGPLSADRVAAGLMRANHTRSHLSWKRHSG